MRPGDDNEFQERLKRLDEEHRSVRRVFTGFLALIVVAVLSVLLFRAGSLAFRPKPHSDREPGAIRNVAVPSMDRLTPGPRC